MEKNPIHLLVVDDDENFLNALKSQLESRDFDVIAVNNGEDAIKIARDQLIDVALVDLNMPGICGEETLEQLKKEHEWMEVVILAGHGSTEDAVECTKKGAYFYLEKTCTIDELLDVLIEAYKERVSNRFEESRERIDELLEIAETESSFTILQKLREYEDEGI